MGVILHVTFLVSLQSICLLQNFVHSALEPYRQGYIRNPFLPFNDNNKDYSSTFTLQDNLNEPPQTDKSYPCGVIDANEVPRISGRNGLVDENSKWKAFLYYYDKFEPEHLDNIRLAVQLVQQILPCIEFREATSLYEFVTWKRHKAFFTYASGDVCSANIGRRWTQEVGGVVYIGRWCTTWIQVIVHETFHVLGLAHEQSRADRDKYIQVHYENIDPKYLSQYTPIESTNPDYSDYGIPYNILSVMHYHDKSYSINGKPTFTPRPGVRFPREYDIGHGVQFSDMVKLRKMYNCKYDEVKDVDLF